MGRGNKKFSHVRDRGKKKRESLQEGQLPLVREAWQILGATRKRRETVLLHFFIGGGVDKSLRGE